MGAEPSHVQLVEYQKEVIPYVNWMMEDIFCRYGVSIPYFLLEFDFPDYPYQVGWYDSTGYQFGTNWGTWGYYLPWFNELLGLAFDWADLPRWQIEPWDMPPWEMPDWKFPEWSWLDWEWPDWKFPEWERLGWLKRQRVRRDKKYLMSLLDRLFPNIALEDQLQAGIGLGIPALVELQAPLSWTIAGKLSAQLGIEIPKSIELQSPDWTMKLELEAKLGIELPISIKPLFPERTIAGKISAGLGIEAPMFTEAIISPKTLAMLNEQISLIYEQQVKSISVGDDILVAEYVDVNTAYTFESQTKDGYLWKTGGYGKDTWQECWDAMVVATPNVLTDSTSVEAMFGWSRTEYGNWFAGKDRGFLSFDTSSLSGKSITTATLRFATKTTSPDELTQETSDRLLYVYEQAWGTLDANDWDGEGDLVGQIDRANFAADDEYTEIDIDASAINTEGETQFKLAWKSDIVDSYVPENPEQYGIHDGAGPLVGGGWARFSSGDASSNKPLLIVTIS